MSKLEQSNLLTKGNFGVFRKKDSFTSLCSNKTICFNKKKISDTRSAKYRVTTVYTLLGGTAPTTENAVSDNLYLNRKGNPYPLVKSTRRFNWGDVNLPDSIPESERNTYVPFPAGKRLLKQAIKRDGDPLYDCLQRMWRKSLITLYEKNKWGIPIRNQAHHIFPVEYGGVDAFGEAIVPSSNLPKFPDLNKCFKEIKVGKFALDNGVILSIPNHRKFTDW